MPTARLRIALMLESDGPGGAEVVVLQLAEELRARGHSVVPVGPANGEGWLGGRFRAAGFETETFVLRRALDWRAVAEFTALFRRHRVDVVHSHEFTMAVYGAAAARRAGARHVITMHGNQLMTRALRRRVALRWAFRQSAATTAVSFATKVQLDQDLGIPPDRIVVVRNGIPVRIGSAARPRTELGIQPDELMILAVGNLDERKGHLVLLRALHQLDQEVSLPRWHVVIAGGRGGPEEAKLRGFAAEHRFSDRLHILLRREDIPDLQAAADLFVMPSLWEGLPLAVLEAMLAGKPIVASRTSGIPEAIEHGREGLLVAPGGVDELATALRRTLLDASLRGQLGAAARERGLAQFTIAAMADAYEALYRGS